MASFERYWRQEPLSRNRFADDYGPLLENEEAARVSFRSLASLFVVTAVFRPFFAPQPLWHSKEGVLFFEMTLEAMGRMTDDEGLSNDAEWVMSKLDRVFDHSPKMDRASFLKLIVLHQARVESRDGIPVQLFPFTRDPAPDAPRTVVIDPELRFGRPTVKGAPTDVLVERWRAGDSPADLAEDYGLTTDEVDEALRYEASPYHNLLFPFSPFGW